MFDSDQRPPTCPVCRAVSSAVRHAGLYDDRYGYTGRFQMRECRACTHLFLDASFAAEELGRLYTDYYPRSTFALEKWQPHRELSRWRMRLGREHSAVFRWVPRNCRVLDVGCGFGESLGYHQARGCEAAGIDTDANIRRVGERYGYDVRVGLFRAADYPAAYYDYLTLDQVIEHTADPVQLLREAAQVLKPGGKLLVGTPNGRSWTARALGRRWVHWHTPFHLQLFSARSLRTAADEAGVDVEWIRYITPPRWYGFQWLHLLSRPPEGKTSVFWRPTDDGWPPGRLPLRKCISALGHLGVNHLVAAVSDLSGQGDNLVAAFRKRG